MNTTGLVIIGRNEGDRVSNCVLLKRFYKMKVVASRFSCHYFQSDRHVNPK